MEKRGIVTISDRAVMQIAAFAAINSHGIAEMTAKTKQEEVSRSILGQGDTAGVYILKTKSGVVLDVYVACRYGVDVSEVKNDAQTAIADAFVGTGVNIKAVNVHINSVR